MPWSIVSFRCACSSRENGVRITTFIRLLGDPSKMLVIIIAISHGYSVAPLMSSRAGPVSHTLGVRPLLTRRGSSSSLCLWGHMKDGIYVCHNIVCIFIDVWLLCDVVLVFCSTTKWVGSLYTLFPLSWTSLPPRPILLLWAITEHWAELLVLNRVFPRVTRFAPDRRICQATLSVRPTLSFPAVSTSLFCISASLFLPYK